MKAFTEALLAYHRGDESSCFEIHRADGYSTNVPASPFFSTSSFSSIDKLALDHCRGSILDVGAGVGRHSLELQNRGCDVTALEIIPELGEVMYERGVKKVITGDLFELKGHAFDTLLMLMNGIGMVKTMEGLDAFLVHARTIVSDGGQILCDSTDVFVTEDPLHVAHRECNLAKGIPAGQQELFMKRGDEEDAPFDWLHISFNELAERASEAGWDAKLLDQKTDGQYLCSLKKV
eukprot:Seg19667.2 transcript_id=Seg19667.2/GoldUCD/mRNA.D3Y31 product="hypothetical protein" protein_id=Seg19667.2/GoldUCD/D3Y31